MKHIADQMEQKVEESELSKDEYDRHCAKWGCGIGLSFILPLTLLCLAVLVLYCVLMTEVYYTQTRTYLKHIKSSEEVMQMIQYGKTAIPSVTLNVKCWHDAKRPVVTVNKHVKVSITRCVDASGELDPNVFTPGTFTRVSLFSMLIFSSSLDKHIVQ